MTPNRFESRANTQATTYDEGLRSHFRRVYNTMSIGLVLTGLMAWFTATTPALYNLLIAAQGNTFTMILVMFSPMIIVGFAFNPSTARKLSASALTAIFFGFSIYFGWLLSTLFVAYTGASIARVFFITAGTFAAMSVWGYTTKKDLSSMGSFLVMGIIGMIIAMVVNIFLQSTMMMFVISGIGVVVYTLLIAYDTQNIKETYNVSHGQEANAKMAVLGALSLYLNFIMLMQFLMQFLGERR